MTERIYERASDTLLKPKEEIIRCKDCKYRELKDFVYGTCKYRIGTVKPDGFAKGANGNEKRRFTTEVSETSGAEVGCSNSQKCG